jgi:hypothetical protein
MGRYTPEFIRQVKEEYAKNPSYSVVAQIFQKKGYDLDPRTVKKFVADSAFAPPSKLDVAAEKKSRPETPVEKIAPTLGKLTDGEKTVRALEMFRANESLVEVAITLKLDPDTVMKLHEWYLKLEGKDAVNRFYEKHGENVRILEENSNFRTENQELTKENQRLLKEKGDLTSKKETLEKTNIDLSRDNATEFSKKKWLLDNNRQLRASYQTLVRDVRNLRRREDELKRRIEFYTSDVNMSLADETVAHWARDIIKKQYFSVLSSTMRALSDEIVSNPAFAQEMDTFVKAPELRKNLKPNISSAVWRSAVSLYSKEWRKAFQEMYEAHRKKLTQRASAGSLRVSNEQTQRTIMATLSKVPPRAQAAAPSHAIIARPSTLPSSQRPGTPPYGFRQR